MKFRQAGSPKHWLRDRGAATSPKGLRLVHVTSVGAAREILHDGQLNVKMCPVFKKELNYFFVLRPAYKLKNEELKQSLLDYFPVVFLFRTEFLTNVFHVYPFDTGGAYNGNFNVGSSPWLYLDDFELGENLDAAAAHIEWAFGSKEFYFDGNLKHDLVAQTPNWDAGPHAFQKIARLARSGHNQPDIRSSAIEIAYAENISLKGNLESVIVPQQYVMDPRGDNKEFLSSIRKYRASWVGYDWQPNQKPSYFHQKINQIVRAKLKSKRLI